MTYPSVMRRVQQLRTGSYLDIERRGLEPLVPEQHLDHADIHFLFEEESGKAVQEDPMTRRCT